MPFISNLQVEGNKMIIEVNADRDIRPNISQAITRSGDIIISMNIRTRRLEDMLG